MLTRRALLALGAASVAMLAAGPPAWAQSAAEATAFIQQLGGQLVAVVNGPGTAAAKRARLEPLITQAVDMDAIGRFCLGRYWRVATPPQQQEYLQLFHQVVLNNIAGRLGEFQGITFTMANTAQRENDISVGTVIQRPNQQPNQVQWIVSYASGRPRIIDVIAEGTSLRLTQRSDYAAYIARNGNSVDALLNAMRQQAAT